jgi:flagellar basal-body rod protein FlgB
LPLATIRIELEISSFNRNTSIRKSHRRGAPLAWACLACLACGVDPRNGVDANDAVETGMSSGILQSSVIPVLEQAVNFGQARHNVLAGNIANVDTPGYRARDLSTVVFQDRLKEAIETRNSPTSAGTDPLADDGPELRMSDAFQTILRHDDGKVSLEQQVAELTKNQMQYNMALSVLTQQFRLLQAAISEKA